MYRYIQSNTNKSIFHPPRQKKNQKELFLHIDRRKKFKEETKGNGE